MEATLVRLIRVQDLAEADVQLSVALGDGKVKRTGKVRVRA